jgi:hypothetical protein
MEPGGHEDSRLAAPPGAVAGLCPIGSDEYPARLSVTDANELVLRFDARLNGAALMTDLHINLLGLIEAKIIPDPSVGLPVDCASMTDAPEFPSFLLITYLEDMFDSSSVKTVLFSAITRELDEIQQLIGAISKELQRRLLFEVPDLTPRHRNSVKHPKNERPIAFTLEPDPPIFLDPDDIRQVRLALPLRMRQFSWERVFRASLDGVCLSTMYQKSANRMPLLLFILTSDHSKIGAYLPTGLAVVKGYTGSGETFVFTMSPDRKVYRWSQKNDDFYTASRDDIAIGGGTGSAIYLTDALEHGFSSPCETFDSETLTTKGQFEILEVELWHVRRYGRV